MREGISKLSSLALIALLTISALAVFVPHVKAQGTTLEIIATEGLAIGSHDSNFTSDMKGYGDTFVINITIVDVTDLQNWQVKVTWDASLLDFVTISLPSDHVFAASGKTMITPPPDVGPGYVIWGCTYINDPYWTFNGSGRLCQLTLRIAQGVSQGGPTLVSCNIAFAGHGTDTFILNGAGSDIPFSEVNGRYFLWWVAPSYYPVFYIKPATSKPVKKGDLVPLEIWVRDVSAGWEIIGFQFSLKWNTTFIEPAAPYYTNGTLLEAFQYYPDGVMYLADINQHHRPPPMTPLPDGINYSMFGAILMPDNPPNDPYHAPFVTVGSDGALLMTVYFTAIYDTISPVEDWTWIEFIQFKVDEDTFALNKYINAIPATSEPCHYRAPMKVLGLGIDVYTQYPAPYGGQGEHQPSDMFGPQQLVDLFALVTYNEYPVQQKLVGFHIRHNGYDIYREATTDENGVAHVSFRLPWPCVDPVGEIFGKWYVIANVEVAEQKKNDTLGFWVWWPCEVVSIEPKETEIIQRKTGGDPMNFTMVYRTFSMQELDVTLTATTYDELSFFIGSARTDTTVGWGEYKYYNYMACETPPAKEYTWDITIPLPTNAVVGKGTVFGNCFGDPVPWEGGVPLCPEVTNTIDFYIKKPP